MLGLLKPKKNPHLSAARRCYAVFLQHIRNPAFYQVLGVPDTLDGRFDLLLLHMFFLIERAGPGHSDFNQALFDVMFEDMDQTLRETGVGDMGIPKHMRRMMLAFNGRMHAYDDALKGENAPDFKEALRRNLFGTLEDVPDLTLARAEAYSRAMRAALAAQDLKVLLDGAVSLPAPAAQEGVAP